MRQGIFLQRPGQQEEVWNGDGSGGGLVSASPGSVVNRALLHNAAYISPNNFLGTAIGQTLGASVAFTLMIAMSVGGVFRVTITKAANTQTLDMNSGVALIANALYTFSPVLVFTGDTVNFQYSINATIMIFRVLELIPS